MKKDPNLSTLDGLVHLAAKTTIQLKSLDIASKNWDAALKHTMVIHNLFLDKQRDQIGRKVITLFFKVT